jgi:hypothetical protein
MVTNGHIICPLKQMLYTKVTAPLKKKPCSGKGINARRYLGGDISFL